MDMNGDLEIMSHVGHLWRTPEFVRKMDLDRFPLVIVKFHKMSHMSHQMSHL